MQAIVALSWILVSVVLPLLAAAQEPQRKPTPEEFAKYRELTRPGPEHEMLKSYSGEWKVTVRAGHAGQREPSTGAATTYMMMEDRFLWIGYGARGPSGRFRGSFIIGYDRRHERFDLIAMDTDGTYFITSHGKRDEKSGTIKLYGVDDDPYMKKMGFEKEFGHFVTFVEPDKFTVDVIFIDTRTPDRREDKGMKFVFERKEKPAAGQETQ